MKKRNLFLISPLLFVVVFIIFASSCKKDDNNPTPENPTPNNPTNGKTTAVFNPDVSYGTMTDQDGNVYKTVTIGKQTWMAENLRTTKYNDGTAIPNIIDNNEWSNTTTGAYCNYNNYDNTSTNSLVTIATLGRLYNWYAVNTGKLAPKGWHVPSNAEWTQLVDYLGGSEIAGGKLKEIDKTHWSFTNTGATNETGFTALPGGDRIYDGMFSSILVSGYWWSATESNPNAARAWCRELFDDHSSIGSDDQSEEVGYSVRCVKN